MRRLPKILLRTVATLLVIVALVVSGLRLTLSHLDSWRPAILGKISAATGQPVSASQLQASWKIFGPALDVHDINADLKDGGHLSIKRATMALDVWQSLLHLRWQFRELTFWQLRVHTNTPLQSNNSANDHWRGDHIENLFFRQFDHFILRDSHLSFLTLSGLRAELSVPQLTWVNDDTRHRAEGELNLSSLTGQHGLMKVRMDLRDEHGLLNKGRLWLQADDIDVKPWLGQWMQNNIALTSAHFSLEAWVSLDKGELASGDLWLKQGGASWQGESQPHHLAVDNLTAHLSREKTGWEFRIPDTRITLDGTPWPHGALALAWIPEQEVGGEDHHRGDELRIRASHLSLSGLHGVLPIAQKLSPELADIWKTMQPSGIVDELALDVPLQATNQSRFQANWKDLAWKPWKLLPGVEHVSGTLSGSMANGSLQVNMQKAVMPYDHVFRAPLEIAQGSATLNWINNSQGFMLDGRHIDVQGTGVHASGNFRYLQPKDDQPWLGILAGIRTDDGGQAWRYFPENLMGKHLVDYLSGAIKAGKADTATLVYGGNPHLFPYKGHEGQFQVYVPLRDATFAFQPNWPALTHLDIDLDFLNNGLWMKADKAALGGVMATNLKAAIPDYHQEQLFIDADINGPGKAVGPYFKNTPLSHSLGATLDELQLNGDVSARLYLDIPLDGTLVTAKGQVVLDNNDLFIKPINSTLYNLKGKFNFTNGNLTSEPLTATWFNQPLNVNFTTMEGKSAYQVGVNMQANWQPEKLGVLPKSVNELLSGSVPWKGNVAIALPYHDSATYKVDITGDLRNVSSHLPSPVNKSAGQPLALNINVGGNLQHFDLRGSLGATNHFNSRWLLGDKLALDRAIWVSDSAVIPSLPQTTGVVLNLPALDGAQWLAMFQQGAADNVGSRTVFPSNVMLHTPALMLGGQQWNALKVVSQDVAGEAQVDIQGREINARLTMKPHTPWQATVNYLYYNPTETPLSLTTTKAVSPVTENAIDFQRWPDLQLRCIECWLWGQKYGQINGDIHIVGNTLTLANGLLDTGFGRLTVEGTWINSLTSQQTTLKGNIRAKKIDDAVNFFGISSPVRNTSVNVDYDLRWRGKPWQPDITSLNGSLNSQLGKGQFTDLSTGHAGRLLRLLSVDALLRKLRFDFSDTFNDGFYFDSIRSTAQIKNGVMSTDDMLVDGLEADIAMQGSIDLLHHTLNMEAVVAPELSATVSVATAFAVNPIVGAAVFAATKVLGPLWDKVSILRYRITGSIEQPQINEVLRQPRSENK